jgi:hypothetical protein
MKTFWERFLDEVQQKRDANEITQEKANHWIEVVREELEKEAKENPDNPISKMPQTH